MTPTQQENDFVDIHEAVAIISKNSGIPDDHISPASLRRRTDIQRVLVAKANGGYKNLYNRKDVEGVTIKKLDLAEHEWVDIHEAVAIISKNNGRPISPDQIRHRADIQKVRIPVPASKTGGRRSLYKREDVERVTIKKHNFPTWKKENEK